MDADQEIEAIILAGGKKQLFVPKQRQGFRLRLWQLCLMIANRLFKLFKSELRVHSTPDLVLGHEIFVRDKTTVEHIIDACRQVKRINRIIVAAKAHTLRFPGADVVVGPGEYIGDSLYETSRYLLLPDRLALVICGDLPFITPDNLTRFINQCQEDGTAGAYISFVRKQDSEIAFPKLEHTYVKLWDAKMGCHQQYCAGGVFMVHPMEIVKIICRWNSFYRHRKSVLRLISKVGLVDLFSYMWGTYTIDRLQKRLNHIFDVDFKGILVSDPALAFNIDDYESYVLAQECNLDL